MPTRVTSIPAPLDWRPRNRLLARLPDADFQRLQTHLRTIPTHYKQTLHPAHDPVREVFFLNGGVASMTAVMNNGAMIEVATIGDEGLVGVTALLGGGVTGSATMMQVPGISAEVLPVEVFRRELNRHGPFADCVHRFAQGLFLLMMQSTACAALHSVQHRCCRWLLMAHDRVRQETFRISHELLAMMVGSTRPTVTQVAGNLQKAGLIQYVHSRLTILDRPGLEAAACECYATIKAHYARLDL